MSNVLRLLKGGARVGPRMVNGRDVADTNVRRCLSCMVRCQADEMVCISCGAFVSQLWPPPGSPRAAHSRVHCWSESRPRGHSHDGKRACWEKP